MLLSSSTWREVRDDEEVELGVRVDHMVLVTEDVERAVAFYSSVLGAQVRGLAE